MTAKFSNVVSPAMVYHHSTPHTFGVAVTCENFCLYHIFRGAMTCVNFDVFCFSKSRLSSYGVPSALTRENFHLFCFSPVLLQVYWRNEITAREIADTGTWRREGGGGGVQRGRCWTIARCCWKMWVMCVYIIIMFFFFTCGRCVSTCILCTYNTVVYIHAHYIYKYLPH